MKFPNRAWLATLFILAVFTSPPSRAQTTQKTAAADAPATSDAEKRNIQAYTNLLRENVRQDKAEIMGAVMVLSCEILADL